MIITVLLLLLLFLYIFIEFQFMSSVFSDFSIYHQIKIP